MKDGELMRNMMKTYNANETHDHVEMLKIVQCFREFIEERRRSESIEKSKSWFIICIIVAHYMSKDACIWELEEDLTVEDEDTH